MAIFMKCMNSECKNYWEDNCVLNIHGKRIEIDAEGKCITFEKGINDWYKCELLENGKCTHPYANGELNCNGTDEEKTKCMWHNELM